MWQRQGAEWRERAGTCPEATSCAPRTGLGLYVIPLRACLQWLPVRTRGAWVTTEVEQSGS